MTTNTEENNPFLTLSSDEDFAIVEEEPLAQNKNIDIFSLFNFLNDPIQLAAKLRYYNILKNTVYCSSRGCRREMRAEKQQCGWLYLALWDMQKNTNYSCGELF